MNIFILICSIRLLWDLITLSHYITIISISNGMQWAVCSVNLNTKSSHRSRDRERTCGAHCAKSHSIFIICQCSQHTQISFPLQRTEKWIDLYLAPHHLYFDAMFRLSHSYFWHFLFNAFVIIHFHPFISFCPTLIASHQLFL